MPAEHHPDIWGDYNPLTDPATWVSLVFCLLAIKRARAHQRNPWMWGLLGYLFGPFAYIALWWVTRAPAKATAPAAGVLDAEVIPAEATPTTPSAASLGPAPSLTDAREQGWYYVSAKREPLGPFSRQELFARMRAQGLPPSTLVWHHDLSDWTEAQKVESLRSSR
jgi:hypothetical protein